MVVSKTWLMNSAAHLPSLRGFLDVLRHTPWIYQNSANQGLLARSIRVIAVDSKQGTTFHFAELKWVARLD